MTKPDLQTDVLVRAWEPHLGREGARFKAVTVRRDITMRIAHRSPTCTIPSEIVLPGLVVIAPSGGLAGPNAVDVCIRAIPDAIKFTLRDTPELVWLPISAHRDWMKNWEIECVPLVEWVKFRLGAEDPEVARTQDDL